MLGIDKANSEFNILNMDEEDGKIYQSLDLRDKMDKKSELTYKIEMVDFVGGKYDHFELKDSSSPKTRKSKDFIEARQ